MYKDDNLATKILLSDCNSMSLSEIVNVIANLLVNVKLANKELAIEEKTESEMIREKTGFTFRKEAYEMTEKSLQSLYDDLLEVFDEFLEGYDD